MVALTKLPQQIPKHQQSGFSLIELSIVLVVVSLLASQLLIPATAQRQQQAIRETDAVLSAARDALLSYAVLTGSLPCPDYSLSRNDPNYGLATASCHNPSHEGWLPFRSLGLAEGDGSTLSSRLFYRVDPNFTHSSGQPIRVSTAFSSTFAGVYDAQGIKLTSDAERPIAVIMATGPDGVLNGQNTHFSASQGRYEAHPPSDIFDDQVIWLGRPILFSWLIRSGQGF